MRRRSVLGLLAVIAAPRAEAAPTTITVIGDSHGRGIAIGLHRVREGLWVQDLAVGGTGSWQMPVAPDNGSLVVVSAGTVDCGTRDPDEKMVSSILRVLGPFADGTQKHGGRLVFVVPHDRLRGQYAYVNPRITKLRELLIAALTARAIPFVVMDADPAEDGVHLDLEGYTALAGRVLERLP